MDTWILRMCRRSCLRQLAVWGAVAVLGLVLLTANARYFNNLIQGPFVMSGSELDRISDPAQSPHYFVRVAGTQAIDTGIQEITVRKRSGTEIGRSVSAGFYALDIGDKFLVVKSSSGQPLIVEGELQPMPADLAGDLFGAPETAALRPLFYPFYLDTGAFRTAGYLTIVTWIAFLALAAWKALPAWRRLSDSSKHPLVQRAATWGHPMGVSVAIEQELSHAGVLKRGTWRITPSYLVNTPFFSVDVLRWCDLLWAYKQVTKHSVNFIPTGKTYATILICYGGTATIPGSDKEADEMLQIAATRAPWAILGHSQELVKAFNEQTSAFCAAVEERRRAWQASRVNGRGQG